mgnify:CR=1 FL=1
MKVTVKQLMDHLGIDHVLMSYESDMYQHFDSEKSRTCSAEARMGPDMRELEVDVQIFRDMPAENEKPFEQIMYMVVKPKVGEQWEPVILKVKNENMAGKFPDWETGAFDFYRAISHHLKAGEFPDIDALIDEHLDGKGGQAGRAGRRGGGRKNPKFKPPASAPKNPGIKSGM